MTSTHNTSVQPRSGDLPSALYKKLAWRILPLASICYAVAIIDRVNIGFAKLEMSADIGLSAAAYGLGAGIFFLAYVLFEVPSNMILERVGAKMWIARIMVTWGIVTIATGFVQNTEQFYGARILLGIAEAGFYPGMVYFLSQWFPRKRLAQALALLVIAGPIGSMFVGPFSGWIMSGFAGIADLAGWQWLFIIQGIPAVLLGIIFYFAVSSSPKDAAWLSGSEKSAIVAALGSGAPRERASKQFKKAVTNKRVWILGFVLASNYIGIYAVIFWIPTILKNTGVTDVVAIGYLSSIPWVVAVAATIGLGIYCDRSQQHRRILVGGMIVAAAGLVASVALGNQLAPTLIGISVASALFTATGPIIWTITNLQLKGMAAAAAGIALINTVGSMGSFLGPYLMGLGQEWTGSVIAPLLFIAGVSIVGALVGASIARTPKTQGNTEADPSLEAASPVETGVEK
jgi:sugar phosphate permease